MKDYLYDLSNSDVAATYYGTYLDNYTYDDGTVNWLPACAAFEAVGIRGFMSDFRNDYTCMEGLQGASISHGKNMVPYNKNVSLELLPGLDNLKPYIDNNKMYIRLASSEMFSIWTVLRPSRWK